MEVDGTDRPPHDESRRRRLRAGGCEPIERAATTRRADVVVEQVAEISARDAEAQAVIGTGAGGRPAGIAEQRVIHQCTRRRRVRASGPT